MNKQEILSALKKYNLDKDNFIILSGASMVLQDIKRNTQDIDIACSPDYYNALLEKYNCTIEKIDNGKKIYFIDNIINFGTNYYESSTIQYNGYNLQSAYSIKQLKQTLNRAKDELDIKLIDEFLK